MERAAQAKDGHGRSHREDAVRQQKNIAQDTLGQDVFDGELVVVGASAGGIEALTSLVAGLPEGFAAAVLVVVHVPPYAVSSLPAILGRAGPVPATHAQDGEPLQGGRIYVAPPNHHMLVERGALRLSLGPRVNRTRPAIDPLFLSAAQFYGPRVVGVVLSGTLDDGTVGLMDIKRRGGVAMVQDPQDALYSSMPANALARVNADHVLSAFELGAALTRLIAERTPPQDPPDKPGEAQEARNAVLDDMTPAQDVVAHDIAVQEEGGRDGMLTVFTCPDCGGSLWQADVGTLTRFRCHTGHVMSAESLFVSQADNIERSLWYASRSLRDKARLARQLARGARDRGFEAAAGRFEIKAAADEAHAEALERMIESNASLNQSG